MAVNTRNKPSAQPAPQATAARRAALEVISEVRRRSAFAHEVLSASLAKRSLDSRDAGFATRLAYGVIATRGTLDQVVKPYLSDPKKTQPEVLDALALATYELLFEGTESHVAVSQGVALVRTVVPRAAGLANAVLRKVAANPQAAGRAVQGDDPSALSRAYGHPEWIADLMVRRFGQELAEESMLANNEPAPLYMAHLPWVEPLEATLASLAADGADPELLPLDGAIVAHNGAAGVRSSALARGAVVVADVGAQLAVSILPTQPGGTVLDVGSGRGTKSLLVAAKAYRSGAGTQVVGVELHPFKVKGAVERATQLAAPNVSFVVADGTALADMALPGVPQAVDAALLDAPCTGLGTLRRHPDRRWKAKPSEVEALSALNLALLTATAARVRVGGTVIYSTCTITREENELVVEDFLNGPDGQVFELVPLEMSDFPDPWDRFVTTGDVFQSVPLTGGIDGHFIARMRRVG